MYSDLVYLNLSVFENLNSGSQVNAVLVHEDVFLIVFEGYGVSLVYLLVEH